MRATRNRERGVESLSTAYPQAARVACSVKSGARDVALCQRSRLCCVFVSSGHLDTRPNPTALERPIHRGEHRAWFCRYRRQRSRYSTGGKTLDGPAALRHRCGRPVRRRPGGLQPPYRQFLRRPGSGFADCRFFGIDELRVGIVHLQASASMDWFATARVRAGFATDAMLVYVTGGLAFGNVDYDATYKTGNAIGAPEQQRYPRGLGARRRRRIRAAVKLVVEVRISVSQLRRPGRRGRIPSSTTTVRHQRHGQDGCNRFRYRLSHLAHRPELPLPAHSRDTSR